MDIHSEIMGTIMYFHAEDGVEMQEGEPVLTIEVMKLMHECYAPCSGVVKYLCKLGDVVEEGQVVARIEEK